MHEVDMTRCLLLSLAEWRDSQPSTPVEVRTVHLDVGEFTCVEPDALVTTYAAAVGGTWLERSSLQINSIPLVGRCPRCESTYTPTVTEQYRSPCCSAPLEDILSGRELRIRRIESAPT